MRKDEFQKGVTNKTRHGKGSWLGGDSIPAENLLQKSPRRKSKEAGDAGGGGFLTDPPIGVVKPSIRGLI